mmetsp:Transcript_111276/g.221310  ORF Transcript_111276/g.221310 Transcript_111276/m.221310 type:complete len:88 (-) Transcript_111276:124-387(-)
MRDAGIPTRAMVIICNGCVWIPPCAVFRLDTNEAAGFNCHHVFDIIRAGAWTLFACVLRRRHDEGLSANKVMSLAKWPQWLHWLGHS